MYVFLPIYIYNKLATIHVAQIYRNVWIRHGMYGGELPPQRPLFQSRKTERINPSVRGQNTYTLED